MTGSDAGAPMPRESPGLLEDARRYLLARPPHATALRFADPAVRTHYEHRILQRLGIRVADYAILNIHRVGVEAPGVLVWEEIQQWEDERTRIRSRDLDYARIIGDHLARLERVRSAFQGMGPDTY